MRPKLQAFVIPLSAVLLTASSMLMSNRIDSPDTIVTSQSSTDAQLIETDPHRESDPDLVPTTESALFPYLRSGQYKTCAHEASIHPSLGPHQEVKTYINPVLEKSLRDGGNIHPVNAAAVKELYRDGQPFGWAVMVKVKGQSDGGRGWYWYEVLSTSDSSKVVAAGTGVQFCAGCHTLGRDYVRTSFSGF